MCYHSPGSHLTPSPIPEPKPKAEVPRDFFEDLTDKVLAGPTEQPCTECKGRGFGLFLSKGRNLVQRCDTCQRFMDDEAATIACFGMATQTREPDAPAATNEQELGLRALALVREYGPSDPMRASADSSATAGFRALARDARELGFLDGGDED